MKLFHIAVTKNDRDYFEEANYKKSKGSNSRQTLHVVKERGL